MDVLDMRIFARVAALQNQSAVGIELGLTPGTISKRIQGLEDELSVRLFDRTTRSIRITDEGRKFLTHIEQVLDGIELAKASVSDAKGRPKGRITLSAPASLAHRFIAPAICAFMQEFPDIDVQIDLADKIVNLQEGGYDLAIRLGELSDSSLIAKRLAAAPLILAAAPSYLKKHGTPTTPAALSDHKCLILGETMLWSLQKNGKGANVRVGGGLRSNNGELLRHAAIEGHGIIRSSQFQLSQDLANGSLKHILPSYEVATNTASNSAIWAVYPSSKHVLPKLRVFLDFLGVWFQTAEHGQRPGNSPQLGIVSDNTPSTFSPPKRAANG